jgi:hypothetical protein
MIEMKKMTTAEIKKHIRDLECHTTYEPIDDDTLDAMTFFDWEDYVALLEYRCSRRP